MTIDIISMIIGGIVWELLSAYIYFVIKPRIKEWRNDHKQSKDENKTNTDEKSNRKTIGFTNTTN